MNDWSRPHLQTTTTPRSTRGSPIIMMQQLGWSTLEERRKQARAVTMYRIVHGQIAIPAPVYLTPSMQSTRGRGSRFCIPAGCVDTFRHSFFPVTIRIWNSLPSDVVMSPSLEVFKSRLAGAMVMQRTD